MNPPFVPDVRPSELLISADFQDERLRQQILDRLSKSPLLVKYLREVILEETLTAWEQSIEFTLVSDPDPLDASHHQAAILQLYKQTKWGHLLNSRFLMQKAQLDRVLFSAIQVTDLHLAEELYCCVAKREHSFTKLASIHSQSPVAKRGGSIGPVAVCQLHPIIQDRLIGLEPKQLSPIFQLDEHHLILRLDRWLPAQFNSKTQQQLLDELFEQWMRSQIEQRMEIQSFT